jgi:predicted RNA-binding Zn-ribbon protein involved in translation (DUF1610 family)
MSEVLEKCSVCHALLDEEDLFCANCGAESPHRPDTSRPAVMTATHNFVCAGCGASMSYDARAQALRCPFCGSDNLSEDQDTKTLKPKAVVPFQVTLDVAETHLRRWLASSWWRPGDLARAAVVERLTKVYVPYWVFSAQTFTYWTADSSQVPLGARGNWAPVAGNHRSQYRGLLIGASSVLTPAETNALCPFDMSAAAPPEQLDLESIVYEQFRVQRKYARGLAQQGLEELERQACRQYVPGNARNVHVNVRTEGLASEPMLLPVWIMAYRYRDQVFRFLVNGQTGKSTGTAPTSLPKVIGVTFAVIAGVALFALLAALCAGVLGR